MNDKNQAAAFIEALTGNPNTVCDFRAIHETDRSVPAIPRRGTLDEYWQELCDWNGRGYGVYITINETDGHGRDNANVTRFRAHMVDLDNFDATQQFGLARTWSIPPAFGVNTSPNKYHVYWRLDGASQAGQWETVQRKLVTQFNGDATVIDPARIMRLPGTMHRKAEPFPVVMWQLEGAGQVSNTATFDATLWNVQPSSLGGHGGDHIAIGQGERAPDTATAIAALHNIDVAQITDRNQWVAITGAFMQAIDPADWNAAYEAYQTWNNTYPGNDPAANLKLWNDTTERGTVVKGWGRLHTEAYGLSPQQARLLTGAGAMHPHTPAGSVPLSSAPQAAPAVDTSGFGPILDPTECAHWFDGCVLISSEGKIFCDDNVFRDSSSFNAYKGGKAFVITFDGKTTDEPWKAATRSQLWRIPQAQFTCFRPDLPYRELTKDALGRDYVNLYKAPIIDHREGDVTPFLRHLEIILPDQTDRDSLIAFLAHNVKFPGHKIFWAPLLQGAEGIGKNVFKYIMQHAITESYFYEPKAKTLNESGAKFNGWMENKCFFLVDEIKTDDKREMVETLKPFITEIRLEIEGKGANQRMGDTPGNWLFFSNWKDAIPVNRNTRRHAIYYSAIQTLEDIHEAGLTDDYFNRLYNWLNKEGGKQFVTHWLMNHPITLGGLPVRAPVTTSTASAITESQGWLEGLIIEAIATQKDGFKGGWVSTSAVARIVRNDGRKTVPAANTLAMALRSLGFHKIGQAGKGYFNDDPEHADKRSVLWHKDRRQSLTSYAIAQNYVN